MERQEIENLLEEALFGRLGLAKDEQPYVVPFCFYYENKCIYLHCGLKGQKLHYLENNARVCFQVDNAKSIVKTGPSPCKYNVQSHSVIAFGKAHLEDNKEKKQKYLAKLAAKYTKEESPNFTDEQLSTVNLVVIEIDTLTGKTYPSGA